MMCVSSYEMRRECQEIAPGLYLGPFQVSKELNKLQALSITHMCVQSTVNFERCCVLMSVWGMNRSECASATRKRLSRSNHASRTTLPTLYWTFKILRIRTLFDCSRSKPRVSCRFATQRMGRADQWRTPGRSNSLIRLSPAADRSLYIAMVCTSRSRG